MTPKNQTLVHKRLASSTGWRTGVALLALAVLAVLGCGGERPPSQEAPVAQLVLSPSNPQIAQGTAQSFSVRGLAPSGRMQDLTGHVRWQVTKEGGGVQPLPVEGLLQLEEPGRYEVTAQYAGRTMTTRLTVTAATLKSVSLSPSTPQVALGLTQPFTATALFSDGTTQDVTRSASWSIKDVMGSGVAVISSVGVATPKSVGKARVTVRYKTLSTTTTLTVTAAKLLTLAISPSNPSIAKGTMQAFVARGTYTDGSVRDLTADVDWSVSDLAGSGVATIDGTGGAFGLAVGQATVGAAFEGKLTETTLTVTEATVVSLTLSPATARRARGTTQPYTAFALLSDGSLQDVTDGGVWTASDVTGTSVASVDKNGLAKANSVGTANIGCAYAGHSASATLTVTPPTIVGLSIRPASASIARGLTQLFTAQGSYTDGSEQDLTAVVAWTSVDVSGVDVASVSGAGEALGINVGRATISAAYLGQRATATLTVTPATLVSLAVSPGNPVIRKGAKQQFTATGIFSDGTTQGLTMLVSWTATDVAPSSGVATVTAGGEATGNKEGLASIAATYLGKTAETRLRVNGEGICSKDGWCWRNPLPQINGLIATWGSNANNVWAVGRDGTILKWNGSTWAVQTSGTTQLLFSVWGTDANNVWAVGDVGTILKWNGSSWAAQASGTTRKLYGVWGTDANNVWAVGRDGTILKWNGSTWAAQTSGTVSSLYRVWGADVNTLWAVGVGGTLLKWNGSSWAAQTSGTTQDLYAVWGTDANNAWAVGDAGTIRKWNGSTWAAQASDTSQWLYGVWGTDANNVWAVGGSGTIVNWNGSKWSKQTSGTTTPLYNTWGTNANNVWAVGHAGMILKWDGSSWISQTSVSASVLAGVGGTDANNVWVVGMDGTIVKWNGTSWAGQKSGATQGLYGVWGADATNVWAVGDAGTILKWNGSSWARQASGITDTLFGVWGADVNNVWAVGQNGTIKKWIGSGWTAQTSGTTSWLYNVWGTDANNVWAVGDGGTIVKWNGSSWAVQTSGSFAYLYGVGGTDANNVWAVGESGTILKWNGSSWAAQASGTTLRLISVWGRDANNVWAVGDEGTILKWNGTNWAAQASGTKKGHYCVWGSDANNVWVVGEDGMILHYVP